MKILITGLFVLLSITAKAQVQKAYEQYVPTGAVMAFALSACPTGWLMADGSSKTKTAYPKLSSTMGTIHGGNATTFNVPDYRGRFLRMIDGGSGRDADRGGRTAMASGGNAGDAVGSVQNDMYGVHNHLQNAHQHTGRGKTNDTQFPLDNLWGLSTDSGLGINANTSLPSGRSRPTTNAFDSATATNNESGGAESRPKNAYVIYCIKY